MSSALSGFSNDALRAMSAPSAQGAFAVWGRLVQDTLTDEEARETFAGEAAFAAAARLVLEDDAHLGPLAAQHAKAFPHLFGSPLFSWYEPDAKLRAQIAFALAAAPQEPLELLAVLYELSIPTAVRKRFGQFYTRAPIVRSMLDNVGFSGPGALSGRLIDPAAGAGAFLIEATRRVLAAADDEGLSPAEACASVQRVIHGLDINPLGILLTEAAIALLLTPRLVEAGTSLDLQPLHLYVTDTLRSGELDSETHAGGADAIKNRTGEYAEGFDYVVANPPYAKHPSRLLNDAQKRRFAATTYGHPNLYGLFLQVGVELLADGGRLSFINPKSFVSGAYFRNLRRFLAEHLNIERFDMFAKRTGLFDGVLQEVVILTATRSAEQNECIQLREFSGAPDGEPAQDIDVDSSSVLLGEEFDYAYFVSAEPLAHRVLARMTDDSRPLSTFGFKAVTGTIVWNRVKEHIRDEEGIDTRPLIWGNGIRMFRFAGLGNRAGAASNCALVPKTVNIVSRGHALLVKRMTAREEARRLVACRLPDSLANDERGYFAENHVNIIRPVGEPDLDLDVVLGLLNSRLFDYVFRALNGNTNVSATELELLPVVDGAALDDIAASTRRLTAAAGADPQAEADLNDAVYRLYGIDAADVAALEGEDALALAS
jgi:adenine-specific DNA-methyltransferase